MSKLTFFNTLRSVAKKKSPQIMIGLGIAGGITTTVLAVKATPKAIRLLQEARYSKSGDGLAESDNEEDLPSLTPVEVVKTTWKCYIPAVITGGLSIACILGANSVHARRNAAIATAYKLSETAFAEYKEKVVEEIGEKKEKVIRDKVNQEHVNECPVTSVVFTGSGKTLCYDGVSGRYFESDIAIVQKAVNELNRDMTYDMYVSLSDFYDKLGLPHTDVSDDLGWNLDQGLVEVDFGSAIAPNGTPCVTLSYRVAPRYDYSRLS